MITHKPNHLTGFDYCGFHRYFLTFCTSQRRRVFVDDSRVAVVREQILRASRDERFVTTAYCFMPDHLHLLVEATSESADALTFIARAKQLSGFHYQRVFGTRLWQRYGYEHTLRSDEDTLRVARYIVENPVRARLVGTVADYPFVGSETHPLAAILDAVQTRPEWRRSG